LIRDNGRFMTVAPGTRFGSCEVISLLGAGGMGEVYRARDARLGRDVAVKILPPGFAADAERLARFEQEARAAGSINHPNLLTIHELGRSDGQVYIISELLDGETLRDLLSGGPLPVRRAVDFARQIADGLAAAHEKGVVHRDLKPENIFITNDGRAKILDFGLAKLAPAATGVATDMPTAQVATDPGTVMGTAGYMSPEQVRGQAVDYRSDIFSFGAVVYEMLTGRRAFRGDSIADTMSAVLREDPPEIASSGSSIPPQLERVVQHCLEKNASRRFQAASDISFQLETLSTSGSQPLPALPSSRRVRPLQIGGALLLLGLGALAGVLIARRQHPTSNATYRQLTFRRGGILTARFTRDGKTVAYGAVWDGKPARAYAVPVDNPLSRDLGVDANVLAVSSNGEAAVLSRDSVLSRLPLAGGAPRQVATSISVAEWLPDGKDLVVVRLNNSQQQQIEFPIGHVVYRSPFINDGLRTSPDGTLVAFSSCDTSTGPCFVGTVDRHGNVRRLASGLRANAISVAWSTSAREIWFNGGTDASSLSTLSAVSLDGAARTVATFPAHVYLHDIAANGDVLLEFVERRDETTVSHDGGAPSSLSWLDRTFADDLSTDGTRLLFSETSEGEGGEAGAYLRATDGSPPVRLSDGYAERLSRDGTAALVYQRGVPPRQVLVPTGAGSETVLQPQPQIADYDGIDFLPGGRAVVFAARSSAGASRLYSQQIGAAAHPITPEGYEYDIKCRCVSPDGKWVVATGGTQLVLVAVDGSATRPLVGWPAGATPFQWTSDSRGVLAAQNGDLPRPILRFDITTGATSTVATFAPADPAGFRSLSRVRASDDLHTFVYTSRRDLSRLVLARGLQ
jgi:serine/threonine protein kinase/Tol biopolymer transport system component